MVESEPRRQPALLLGIPGATVIDMQENDDKLDLLIETEARPVRCPIEFRSWNLDVYLR
jgi:hypothetical protein